MASDQAGADGVTRIVEVGAKPETERVATAECWVTTSAEAVGHLVAGTKKGDPIQTAKIAGMIGVKQTPALLPPDFRSRRRPSMRAARSKAFAVS